MARPTEYSDSKADLICQRLRAGNTRKASVESVGVAYNTFLSWLARSAEGEEPFQEFLNLVSRAEADAELLFATCVTKAARDGDARMALEWLKRRRRDEWGDNLSLRNLTDEELIATAEGRVPGDHPAGDTPPTAGTG